MSNSVESLLTQTQELDNLGENVSFLQVGRMRYVVTPVGEDLSIINELKDYVSTQITQIRGQITNVFEVEADAQMTKQLEHIQKLRSRGDVSIPASLRNKIVAVRDNTVAEVKVFIYNPWCVKTSYDDMRFIIAGIEAERFVEADAKDKFLRRRNRDGGFSLTFKSSIHLPGAVVRVGGGLRIVNDLKTHHTYDGNSALCIGESDPAAVFGLSPQMLGQQLSIYNRFSPLRSSIACGSQRYEFPDYLRLCSDFVISADSRSDVAAAAEGSTNTTLTWSVR